VAAYWGLPTESKKSKKSGYENSPLIISLVMLHLLRFVLPGMQKPC